MKQILTFWFPGSLLVGMDFKIQFKVRHGAHILIPVAQEAELRILAQSKPRKTLETFPSQQSGPVITATLKDCDLKPALAKSTIPYLKNNLKAKWLEAASSGRALVRVPEFKSQH
jgi:hypothetical protein